MAIIVSEGSTFEPHPEGQFRAVCVDVVERHGVETAWGRKNKVRLVWQTEANRDDGKPFLASASFNASLHEQSRLRPFLEAWRGRKFTRDELNGFDLEALVGVQAVIQITHTEKDGKTYDNVTAIMRPMKGLEPVHSSDYVRVQDREEAPAPKSAATAPRAPAAVAPAASGYDAFPEALEAEDDDLPF